MSQDLVSIIMPSYNAGRLLSGSVDCILQQTYPYWELLITDDGSTDPETLQTLQHYEEQDQRISVEYQQGNRGPGHARNSSIARAQGRYIAFCDSDDRWMADKLERQIRFMQEHECSLSCTSYIVCNSDSTPRGFVIAPRRITFGMLKRDNKVGCLTAVYDTQRLGRKYYMPTMRKRQDWALFLTILRDSGEDALALTEPLAHYYKHGGSVSSDKFSLIRYNLRVYESVLGFSRPKALAYFLCLFLPTYFTKVLKKKYDSWVFMKKLKRNQVSMQ